MSDEPEECIEVPLTLDFDPEKIVGTVRLKKEALPPTPEWALSLGYRMDGAGSYTPVTMRLIPDANYAGYLERKDEEES